MRGYALPSRPSRRVSTTLSGYDALLKCKLAIEHTEIPAALGVDPEIRELAEKEIPTLDPEIVALCRRELSRLQDEGRIDAEYEAAHAEALRRAEARRQSEEAERRELEERERKAKAEEENRQRQARIHQARVDMERRRNERQALDDARRATEARRRQDDLRRQEDLLRRDESYAKRIAEQERQRTTPQTASSQHQSPLGPSYTSSSSSSSSESITRLKALTGADDQTCQFYLDSAGGDVQTAFQIWEMSSS